MQEKVRALRGQEMKDVAHPIQPTSRSAKCKKKTVVSLPLNTARINIKR